MTNLTDKLKTEFLKGRTPDQLISSLKEKEVDIVIDIRFSTWMPIFYKPQRLKQLLTEENIQYFYCRKLGNPSKFRKSVIEEAKRPLIKIPIEELHPLSNDHFKFTHKDISDYKKELKKKTPILKNKPTRPFIEWKENKRIDHKLMDELAKKYYIKHIIENSFIPINKIISLIKKNPQKTLCFLCSCNVLDPNKCHRFWFLEYLTEKLINK